MILLDTCAIVAFVSGRYRPKDRFTIGIVSYGEIVAGCRQMADTPLGADLSWFCSNLRDEDIAPFWKREAEAYAGIVTLPVPAKRKADLMIAATALANDRMLVTADRGMAALKKALPPEFPLRLTVIE